MTPGAWAVDCRPGPGPGVDVTRPGSPSQTAAGKRNLTPFSSLKCTNDPPVGDSKFLTLEGLPSDHYLWLAGTGARLLRGEIDVTEEPPARKKE